MLQYFVRKLKEKNWFLRGKLETVIIASKPICSKVQIQLQYILRELHSPEKSRFKKSFKTIFWYGSLFLSQIDSLWNVSFFSSRVMTL